MKPSWILVIVMLFFISGCGIKSCKQGIINTAKDATTEAIAVLDRGIAELSVASANWQDVLNRVINDLPDEVQSTVTNEVTNLLNRGIAATGAEVRCNVDFFRIRMKQGLQRIKAKLLGSEMPPPEPQLCNVVPLAVDMSLDPNRRNKIEFYGYDFDMANIKVIHEYGNTSTDVSRFLDQPTHYHMTLNLGGAGVNLRNNSKRLILRWNDRNISTIAIIQPSPEICETKFDNFRPSNVTVMPVHARMPGKQKGDKEFDGNGPSMYCSVILLNKGDRIDARIYVTASETRSDWTYGKKLANVTIYNADPGYMIEKIVTPTSADFSYTDNDTSLDEFGGSGPVQKFIFNGDGSGDDIGVHTKVTIQFNPIRVQLKETSDCISSATLRDLEISGLISTTLKQKIDALRPTMHFVVPDEIIATDTATANQ